MITSRSSLLRDAEYFTTLAIRRIESLQRCEPVPPTRSTWQQSAALIRRVRRELRLAQERDREARRREQRLQESRR